MRSNSYTLSHKTQAMLKLILREKFIFSFKKHKNYILHFDDKRETSSFKEGKGEVE